MKHMKTFDEIHEVFGQKFFTGYENSVERENSKKRIESELDSALEEFNKAPEYFVKYDIDKLKEKLLLSAKEDNYRGKIVIRTSANDPKAINTNKKFIVYEPKKTELQDIGSGAANSRM